MWASPRALAWKWLVTCICSPASSQVQPMAFSPDGRYLVSHSLVEAATPQDKASTVLGLCLFRLDTF